MAAPRYFVVVPPGISVPGVGFCYPGDRVDAPADWTPSFTLRPLNSEARDRVLAVLDARVAVITQRQADATGVADQTTWANELVRLAGLRSQAEAVLGEEEAAILRDHTPYAKDHYVNGRLVTGNP